MRPLKGPSKKRFEVIYLQGGRRDAPDLRMLECPGTGLVGLAIAKRVGSKPQRNRARRRLREALARVELSSDRDRIFIGGSRLLTRPLPELIAQLEDLLGSAPNGPREPEAP